MPVKLNGSTSGSVTVQAPAVAGTNTLTLPAATGNLLSDQSIVPSSASVPTNGMYLPATNALGFATNSTNAMYIDASQNVGIGTSSPSQKLQIGTGASNDYIQFGTTGSGFVLGRETSSGEFLFNATQASPYNVFKWQQGGTERMRINSSGYVLVNQTVSTGNVAQFQVSSSTSNAAQFIVSTTSYPIVASQNGSASGLVYFNYNTANVGTITTNGSATAYNTSSDYRLKNDVQPLSNGLATVSALNPVTYNWIGNGSKGEGFIAHELQTVIPDAVTGIKDAVDDEGKPIYQGVDYSKIVVHLVAAIQELSAEVEALKAKVGA
jgi:hypothetical protein